MEKLGPHVSELMQILLDDVDEREMASRIYAACERNKLPKLGKRLTSSTENPNGVDIVREQPKRQKIDN